MDRIVFFGNEKLSTTSDSVEPLILRATQVAGFEIEQHVTGTLSELRPHKSTLAVLAAYGRIIPQTVLDQFPLGVINVHPSLLPAHRGSTPIEQTILDGDKKTGVSIMLLTAGMDEGPIFKQKTLHLTGDEDKATLTRRLQQLGAELIQELLPMIATGKLKPRQQPHPSRATYSKKLRKEDGKIDWSKPAAQIEREVRAFAGWPKSYTVLAGKDVIITVAHVADSSDNNPLAIETSQGFLVIDRLKPAGKNDMSATEFLRGYGNKL